MDANAGTSVSRAMRMSFRSIGLEKVPACDSRDRSVVVTDHPGQFPRAVREMPDLDELENTDLLLPVLRVNEPVYARLDRTIVWHRIDFETAFDQLSPELRSFVSGKEPFETLDVLLVVCEPFTIVKEFDVLREEFHQRFQILPVE